MNLKDAFRFQNVLGAYLEDARAILNSDSNVTRVENTYLRHKVTSEAEDETVVDEPCSEYSDRITDVARFTVFLLEEKTRLSAAIRKAKNSLEIDVDSEVSLNSIRQALVHTFRRLNELRASEQTIRNGGMGYRFNTDGNQVSYRCDVRRVTTINYDRNAIRSMLWKTVGKADEVSAEIDLCLVTTEVEYTPPFDVNYSFSDAFEAFAEKAGA